VVEEVPGLGSEVADVEGPAVQRERDAELELFVALSMQGQERELTLLCKGE